ncbi:PREDICTED: C-type lectin domain family 2 member D-like isoform X1 [Calidris pugnax]|uniref:C-type lectin domain family 2 member D-like isoform X1 n=1 Tax=Calidris pugnax TaxID=198806 RepID=UPI00071E57ED|nr:PREDICTED: C-type lectin domain family 2 member D-like isoform X1 [Calidris pugnax]
MQCVMGEGKGFQGERNGFCSSNGNMEIALSPQEGGDSHSPEVPGATDRRMHRGVLVKLCILHPVCVLVVSVLVALVLALAVAVAVLSARTCGGDPAVPVAPVLACPDGWVGYHNVCYYLSRDQGSWEWSQEQCSSRGASLAVLRREWEMRFLSLLKGDMDPWTGLRRRGEHLEWVDGSSFNQTSSSRSSKVTWIPGLGCGDGASTWSGWTAAASTRCLRRVARQSVCICSTMFWGVQTAHSFGHTSAASPKCQGDRSG